jgi:hypothetical protein
MFFSKHIALIFLWILLAAVSCSKKDQPEIIARVGGIDITAEEFRKRFELNPRLLQFKDVEQAKIRFLGSLVAEKLLALEGYNQGLAESNKAKAFLDQINREAVIEEFYNAKIASKIQIEEDELRQAYAKTRRELAVQYVSFVHLEEAKKFRERVLAGKSFAAANPAIAEKTSNDGAGIDTLTLKWGQATPAIEDALYRLKPGEVSEPIAALNEFYVARILSETSDAFGTEDDFHQKREAINRILAKRKRSAAFIDYFKKMMVGKKTKVPPERLQYVVEKLEEALSIGHATSATLRVLNPSPMNEIEFSRALQSLETNLNEILVTFDDGSAWTIQEFLQRLAVGRYYLDFNEQKRFRLDVRQAIITMIEQEYVYKEAVKEKLHQSYSVEDEVAIWRENLAAHGLVQQLLLQHDKIPDEKELPALTDEQLTILANTLLALSDQYKIKINAKVFHAFKVTNAGLLMLKTHFPGRLVVPVEIPLENLSVWQEKFLEKIGDISRHE